MNIPDELLMAYEYWVEFGKVRFVVHNATDRQISQLRRIRTSLLRRVQGSGFKKNSFLSVWNGKVPDHLKKNELPVFEMDMKNQYWVNFNEALYKLKGVPQ